MNIKENINKLIEISGFPVFDLDLALILEKDYGSAPFSIVLFLHQLYKTIDIRQHHQDKTILHVVSSIGIHNLLIPVDNHFILIGPFICENTHIDDIYASLLANNIDITPEVITFYHALPIIRLKQLTDLAELIHQFDPNYHFQTIDQSNTADNIDYLNSFLRFDLQQSNIYDFMKQEETLFHVFLSNDVLQFQKALKEYDKVLFGNKKVEVSLYWLKEHYQIVNCVLYQCCYTKAEDINFVDQLYYSYKNSFSLIADSSEILPLQQKMMTSYFQVYHNQCFLQYSILIQKCLRYIVSHYKENISLKDIARDVNMNESHLSTIFKKEVGQTVSDYIQKVRVEYAKLLLVNTTISITNIALTSGFSDVNYFIKVFKKHEGLTPSCFRNKHHI